MSNYIIEFNPDAKGFQRLCQFIDTSFEKDKNNNPVITSKKIKKNSETVLFFKSQYLYDIDNTCNTWIVKVLKQSGFKVSAENVSTAGNLYHEIKRSGRILKARWS
ncbi:MAG: DUF2459 domain-containing protein [bacterium]|nr:DUF2459 domain-containing protein [bacterium]